jgi:predicted transcriptional regulator
MPQAIGSVKVSVKAVLEAIPDDASWDDFFNVICMFASRSRPGLADEASGRLIDTDEMRRRLDSRLTERRGNGN